MYHFIVTCRSRYLFCEIKLPNEQMKNFSVAVIGLLLLILYNNKVRALFYSKEKNENME